MGPSPRRRLAVIAVTGFAAAIAVAGLSATAFADDDGGLPHAVTEQKFNVVSAPPAADGADFSLGGVKQLSGKICGPMAGPGSDPRNVNTDCDESVGIVAPHNETSIAVNPRDPNNIIGGVNDYQLTLSNGGTVKETVLSRAHVSFNGGQTWAEYAVPFKSYTATGDPGIAFDADGTAYYSTLGFLFSQGNSPGETNADVLVSHSTDGGQNWTVPSRVGQGSGSLGSVSTASLDKPYITAWGHGNALVAWTNFVQGPKGSFISSPLMDSVTHDGGVTWTQPTPISGSAAFCVGSSGGNACDVDQGAVPVFSGGHVYIAFENFSFAPSGNDQYLVVQVSPATGQLAAGPFRVGEVVDGFTAYPISVAGRQTYQDSQFRSWSLGNITVDPLNPSHLAVIWSDMRNSPPLVNLDPYAVVTNSDVIVSQSFNGGLTWSPPQALMIPHDQFQPWGAYDATGRLNIGYFDRFFDPANHQFDYSLSTEGAPGSLLFPAIPNRLTTVPSQPTMNDRWFSGIPVNPAFPHATQFLGDYSNIAADPRGGVVAYWTDLRNTVSFAGRTGFGEDAFFARSRGEG